MQREYNYDNKYYDEGIGGFHKASIPYIHDNFNHIVNGRDIKKILDFGCGNGFHSAYLKSKADELDGVDYSDAIETNKARENYNNVMKVDLGKELPEPVMTHREKYDLLFSIEVIEHVKDYRQFIKNGHSLLKKDGIIFLTTTTYFWSIFILLIIYRRQTSLRALKEFFSGLSGNEESKTKFVVRFWDFFTGHYHGFSKSQITNAFRENGFEIATVKYLPIQDVFPVNYLKQPYKGAAKWLVVPGSFFLIFIGKSINNFCRFFNVYSPNILIVARKK